MNILLLHQHYRSPEKGGAIRSYYLTKALAQAGIRVTLITTHNEKKYAKEKSDGIEIHYLPIAYDNTFAFSARIISFIKFTWKASRLGTRMGSFDYCYAISVPLTVGIAAMWIKYRLRIPYIFEVGDLWPEAPVQIGAVKNLWAQKLLYVLEKKIYQSAHSIVALSPSIKQYIEGKVADKKIHLIPNMADCDYFLPEDKPESENQLNIQPNKFTVTYIGTIGVANGLDYFLECANTARKAALPVQFVLMGAGAELERLKKAKEKLGLTDVVFIDFGSRERVKEVLAYTDACFVCYKNLPVLQTGSPNKYFDALAAGKLVIINFAGWIKLEIELEKCGVALDPLHPSDFVTQVSSFLNNPQQLKQYQQNARALALKKYSRAQLSKEFTKVFTNF
ncbi:MAG: glycosyltransferase family 4 protein [Flammeovirgaceae bacterium]